MRASVAAQSHWGSVTKVFGNGYRLYKRAATGSHAWYSLTTAS